MAESFGKNNPKLQKQEQKQLGSVWVNIMPLLRFANIGVWHKINISLRSGDPSLSWCQY